MPNDEPNSAGPAEDTTSPAEPVPAHSTLRRFAVPLIIGTAVVASALAVVATGQLQPTMHALGSVVHDLDTFALHHGYLGVAIGVGVESIGVPLPGEATLMAVSALAGHTHHLSLPFIIGSAATAATIGDSIGYWIGRLGRDWIGPKITSPKIQRELKVSQYLFKRYGAPVVFFGRFVSILRTWAGPLAGANHMPYPRFLIANAAGALVWATTISSLAYFAGGRLTDLPSPVRWGIIGVSGVAAATAIVVGMSKKKALEAKAEQEFPGPLFSTTSDSRTSAAAGSPPTGNPTIVLGQTGRTPSGPLGQHL